VQNRDFLRHAFIILNNKMLVLSTLRMLLRDLDVNIRRRGPKLTPYKRGYIAGARVAGMSPCEIKLII
jgi:hypothetical protein